MKVKSLRYVMDNSCTTNHNAVKWKKVSFPVKYCSFLKLNIPDFSAIVFGFVLTNFVAVPAFSQVTPQTTFKFEIDSSNIHVELAKTSSVELFDHRKESKLDGRISASKKDFGDINIQLKNSSGEVLKTLHPDSIGNFEVDYDWKQSPLLLEVSGQAYETKVLHIPSLRTLSNIYIELEIKKK